MNAMSSPGGPVRVVLAFHAHEPLCDRQRLAQSPIARLLPLAEALGGPISLAISNELAHLLARDLPETFVELMRGYAERRLRPLYMPAHQAPASLLAPDELVDELRLNSECVHDLLGAPVGGRRGVWLGGALDARLAPAAEEWGAEWTFAERPSADVRHPFRVGERLIGLPLEPIEAAPDRERACALLLRALDATPPDGVLAFLYPLSELERVQPVWRRLQRSSGARFRLVAPDELLEADEVTPPWLPEVRPARVPEVANAWEGGRHLSTMLAWLVDAFGFSRTPPVRAEVLFEDDYRVEALPPRAQVPLLLRLAKAGCALPIEADERQARRPFADAARLCGALEAECRLLDARPRAQVELAPGTLEGLARAPELLIDPRLAWLKAELDQQRAEGMGVAAPLQALAEARQARRQAEQRGADARAAYAHLRDHQFGGRSRWRALVTHLGAQLSALSLALEHLERAHLPSELHPAA
jgi:hypothetical protein